MSTPTLRFLHRQRFVILVAVILSEGISGFAVEAGERSERGESGEAEVSTAASEIAAESRFRLEREEIARLNVKGRSQYLAGDVQGARATFQEVEIRDPENTEARKFSQRIAAESVERGELNREKTRTQLLEEVTKSWQRPGLRGTPGRTLDRTINVSPLERKLDELVLPNVSFTRAEIGQVVAALSAISEEVDLSGDEPRGINVVLLDAANGTPTVTLALRNTSLRRILDFVTEAVGYHYQVEADAVVIRPGAETATVDTAFFPVTRATALRMTGLTSGVNSTNGSGDAPQHDARNDSKAALGTSTREAQAIRIFLQQAGVNFDAVRGSSLAYDGSALIVTQTARNLERIRNILIRYSDVRQVEIEAKFMEVQEGALEELGVNWSISQKPTQHSGADATYKTSGRSLANVFSNSSSSPQGSIVRPALLGPVSQIVDDDGNVVTTGTSSLETLPILNNAPQLPGAANLAAAAGALATITGIIGEFDVNAVVRALAQRQGTDLLSAPRVTVLSGNPATITVAQEMRYPQSFGQTQSQVGTGSASGGGSAGVAITAGTPQEFTSRNVGVELRVTPTVEEDDYSISLELNPKVTEFDGFVEFGGPSIAISGGTTVTVPSGFYQPIFSVRDISTKVTLWDGATLVMGGLTREEVKNVNDKVPVLGDIPFFGKLFRSKGESAQKRNLLIFVTANLVSPGGSPKKQNLATTPASSIFQNPTVVTPASAEPRGDSAKK
jgi:general secretion pathway protein D